MTALRLSRLPLMSFLKDKFVGGFIVFCILLNGFVPKFSIEAADYAIFSQIIASQSILLHFLSLSSLPEKIVAELFKDQNIPSPQNTKQPEKQSRNTANTSADFTLVNADSRNAQVRYNLNQRSGDFDGKVSVVMPAVLKMLRSSENSSPGVGSVFLGIFLFFFLLPRSDLSDAGILKLSLRRFKTQLVKMSWVFLFITNDPYRSLP